MKLKQLKEFQTSRFVASIKDYSFLESVLSLVIFLDSESSVTSDDMPFLKLLIPFATSPIKLEILMEQNWVKPHGRKDVPGRPIQYVTTDEFLSHFNLQKLSELPTVDELGSAGLIDSTNIDASIFGSGKFFKEKQQDKKKDIYSNIDEMLSDTLKSEDQD